MNRRRIWNQIVAGMLLMGIVGCGTSSLNSNSVTSSGEAIERVSEKGPVKLVVRVTPRQVRLSDLAEMEIEVSAPSGVDIKTPVFGQAVGDFLVRDYSEKSDKRPAAAKSDQTTRRFHYKLEPMNAGRHLIRSMAVEFVDHRPDSELKDQPSVIESEPFEVEVTSELGDQIPNLAELTPMESPRPLESSWKQVWLTIGAICCLLMAAVVWFRRSKKLQIIEPPRKSPEEIAHAAFAALLAENLPARGLIKDFYLRLTGVVRNYIEATTGLRAPEQTTEEFLQAMRQRNVFSPERSVRLKEFLEAADMVKYAGQQPDNEQIEQSIARGREFVDLRSPGSAASTAANGGT